MEIEFKKKENKEFWERQTKEQKLILIALTEGSPIGSTLEEVVEALREVLKE